MSRPAIPRQLEREILMEAGHRCAIPTCRQTPVEIAHIIPYAETKGYTFDNLIALCPTCHARYDNGDIDRRAMLQYKANLSVINGRYCDLEQRVLVLFSKDRNKNKVWLPGGLDLLLMNLLQDGFLVDTGQNLGFLAWANGENGETIPAQIPSARLYQLTDKGRKFINRWLSAEEID